ncbi:unnamed protein product [Effrenium voratum]|nr:unnamed protein product [Effrenium voratum]
MHAEIEKEAEEDDQEASTPSKLTALAQADGQLCSPVPKAKKPKKSRKADLATPPPRKGPGGSPCASPCSASPGSALRGPGTASGSRGTHSSGSSSSMSLSPALVKAQVAPPISETARAVSLEALAQARARPGGLLDAMRQRGTMPSSGVPFGPQPPEPAVGKGDEAPPRKRSREEPSPALKLRNEEQVARPTAAKSKPQPAEQPTPPVATVKKPVKVKPPVPAFTREPEPWQVLRSMALPQKKAEDNYEISDKGSDSEVEDLDGVQKHEPAWSMKYLDLLQAQADIDADTIFGSRVPRCDLEEVFTDDDYRKFQSQRPPRRRGSSGEWRRDRLSREEVSAYKRKTGQLRRWQAKSI